MNKIEPRFSILMPTLGERPKYLKEAIDSILSQDFKDFELVIKAPAYGLNIDIPEDERIVVVCKKEKNLGEALNQAVQYSHGQILNESNDDDLMLPGTLSLIDKMIGDAEWAYGRMLYGDSLYGNSWNYEQLKYGNFVPQPSVFFRRSAFEKTNGFDENNPLAADYDMWLQLGAFADPVYIIEPLAKYRVHPGQITQMSTAKQLSDARNVQKKYV